MDDEEFLVIEAKLDELARAVGASAVMDRRHYRKPIEDPVTREREGRADRPLGPRERVIEEIKALERHLALFDSATYQDAMNRIAFTLREAAPDRRLPNIPQGARIELDTVDGASTATVSLTSLPDLSAARKSLFLLAVALRES